MADVIREYLIALGWSIDEDSWRKFQGALTLTAKTTGEIGAVAVESAVAIEAMVTRVARQYENLYYVSQRTSQSVGFLQSAQFGFRQIGLSADEAIGSIESVAATMRTQPWLAALFGGARTPQDIADKLGASGLPYFLQVRFAAMAGLDEKVLLHLQKFGAIEKEQAADLAKRQKEAGINPDDLADRFTAFSRVLNKLESDFDILGERMAIDFLNPVQHGIEYLDEFVQWMTRTDNATKGWAGTIGTLATTALGAFFGNKGLMALLRALGLVAPAAGGAAGGVLGGVAGLAMRGGTVGLGLYGLYEAVAPQPAGETDEQEAARRGAELQKPTSRLEQAEAFFTKNGFSPETARGIAAALFFESGKTLSPTAFNPQGGGRGAIGIGQWRGERIDQFRRIFGKDLQQATLEEQLQYVLWEMTQGTDRGALAAGAGLRRGGMPAGAASTMFLENFERPGPGGMREIAESAAFADNLSRMAARQQASGDTRNATLNQHTEIHVSGVSGSVAGDIAKKQQDVNNDLVRNMAGATR